MYCEGEFPQSSDCGIEHIRQEATKGFAALLAFREVGGNQ